MASDLNKPTFVILHCSATADTGDDVTVEDIRGWHMDDNGWDDVAYHYFIRRSGAVEKGRSDETYGAHCYGFNKGSLGICYSGTYSPTMSQLDSLVELYIILKKKYGINYTDWYAHNQFSQKECPGFDINLIRILFKHAG